MRSGLTLAVFAKRLGFKRSNAKELQFSLKYLQKIGALEIQQGGFKGHSLCHPKIVSIKDQKTVDTHFKLLPLMASQPKLETKTTVQCRRKPHIIAYRFTCKLPDYEKCNSRKILRRAGVVCIFSSTCNQKIPIAY